MTLRIAEVSTQYGDAPTFLVTGFRTEASCTYRCEFDANWRTADVVFANVGKSAVRRAHASQIWVGTYWESLAYYPAKTPELWNFTLSYSLDSSFPIFHMISHTLTPERALAPISYETKRRAAWMSAWISNCHARNDRLELLRYLETTVGPVRKVGRCFGNHEPVRDKIRDSSTHLFMYAAENSHCTHYHTEKIFHAFMSGTVPIYVGAASIVRLIPPKSAILVSEYADRRALADHLDYLVHNKSAYEDYLSWRSRPWPEALLQMLQDARTTYDETWRCDVCRTLHTCHRYAPPEEFSCTRPINLSVATTCTNQHVSSNPDSRRSASRTTLY